MRFDVPFGGSGASFEIPDSCLRPFSVQNVAKAAPLEAERVELAGALAKAGRLLIVVNDGFRPTPTPQLLAPFADALSRAREVRFVVATGMHPPPAIDEMHRLIGPLAKLGSVHAHSEVSPISSFGELPDGTPIELNSLLAWAETILLVGSVEPHFFAGYTGGLKQILPGLASRASIEGNHRHAVHPHCRPLELERNPVAEGIRLAAEKFVSSLLSIQAVEGPDGWEVFYGREPATFLSACNRARAVTERIWDEPLDGLVAVLQPPLDRNLYQLQKGFENHLEAVRTGGWILLVSACADGVGNDFFGRLARQYPDRLRLPHWGSQRYSLGLHKLYRTAGALEHCELFLYSQLPADVVESVYLEPVANLAAWLEGRCRQAQAVGVVERADGTVSTVRS